MKRRRFIAAIIGSAATGVVWQHWNQSGQSQISSPGVAQRKLQPVFRTTRALGTNVSLTVYASDVDKANIAIDAAFNELNLIEDLMSLYRPDSQLCRLNRNGYISDPAPELVEVLNYARELSGQTTGLFDVTIQPLWQLYVSCKNEGRLPLQQEIQAALKHVDSQHLHLSSDQIRFHKPGMAVSLNGIAQGYATDAVVKVLQQHGVQSAFIDAGEIGTIGQHHNRPFWKVGIKHPRSEDHLLGLAKLNGRCLATSGDYESHFTADYKAHHLLHPKTGLSPQEFSSVTIAAPSAMQADALSTAVFILGPQKGKELIRSLPDTDALFVSRDGNISQTTNFPYTAINS